MTTLQYHQHAQVEDLAVGECVVRHASDGADKRWWNLWFNVLRETDGQPEVFVVPVAPRQMYTESGPGGRTWGFHPVSEGVWQVLPSINVLDDDGARQVVAGHAPTSPSLWHQTPTVVGVPDDEPWARREAT
jgi:hypothetical protein